MRKTKEYISDITEDNWASQSSEVALRKELEQWNTHFHHQGNN